MEKTKASWICRNYQPGDEASIIHLYRDVFNFEMSPALWRWAYQASPDGPAVIAVLENDGRIVGHYAVQPRKFWTADRSCIAGIAIGTMLLPEVRGLAGLVALARQAYAACRERDYAFLYAFPNDQAHRVRCTLLGWRALPQVVEHDGLMPRDADNRSSAVDIWRQMPDDLDFSAFQASPPDRTVQGVRSAPWLRWRFFDRPESEYVLHTIDHGGRVEGYAIAKRYNREGVLYGHIIDWQLIPAATDRAEELLNSIWRQLAQWNVERVSLWSTGDDQLAHRLIKLGITPVGRKSNFCDYDLQPDDQRLSHPAAATDYCGWRVVMADSDVY